MTPSKEKPVAKRSSPAALVCALVLLMTLYAATIDNITFATNDYRWIVIQAVAIAALALALVPAVWRRASPAARVMLALCALLDLWTLVDAGGRRLPAVPTVMGW